MICLTRLSPLHRVIVAGGGSMELYLALRRRGFIRVTTPALSRHNRTPHTIGLIAGQSSGPGIEPNLEQISEFLAVNAGLALVVAAGEDGLIITGNSRRSASGSRQA
jgi:hypothetical protein